MDICLNDDTPAACVGLFGDRLCIPCKGEEEATYLCEHDDNPAAGQSRDRQSWLCEACLEEDAKAYAREEAEQACIDRCIDERRGK